MRMKLFLLTVMASLATAQTTSAANSGSSTITPFYLLILACLVTQAVATHAVTPAPAPATSSASVASLSTYLLIAVSMMSAVVVS